MSNPSGKGGWKKGESGNPNGRPKKNRSYTEAIEAKFNPKELAALLHDMVFIDHDFGAAKYVYDRLEGKPTETIDQTIRDLPPYVELNTVENDDRTDRES